LCFTAIAQPSNSDAVISLSLKEAIQLAIKQSPAVQAARFQTYEASSKVDQARSALRPQVAFQAAASNLTTNSRALGFNFPGVPAVVGPLAVLDARVTVQQSIVDRSLKEAVIAAGKRAEAQHWNETDTREATALAIVDKYLQILQSDRQVERARARLATANSLLRQASDLINAGVASKLDESRAEGRMLTEQATLSQLLGQRKIQHIELQQLLGMSPDQPLRLTDSLFPLSEADEEVGRSESLSADVEKRPSTRAVEAEMVALNADKRTTEAERYPVVGIAADYGYFGNVLANRAGTYTLRATISIPIYLGGRVSADERTAEERLRVAEQMLKAERLRARAEIMSAQTALEASRVSYESARRATLAATTGLELARARFEGGLCTNIDVISGQEILAEAEAFEIETLFQYYVARATLARAKGDIMSVFNK
jgi:outer membrane protein TolC